MSGLAALAAAAALAAPAGTTPVPILTYHHVAKAPDGAANPALYVSPRLFARQVAALRRAGYTAVTVRRALRHWEKGTPLPERPVVLSFDDGFADQYRNAAPILRRRGWPGVLYLQTARLDAPRGLTRRQVRRMLRDGWELGAHTVSHADLTTLDGEPLAAEVGGSREALRRAFPAAAVESFCYPYGRFDDEVLAAVRAAGFAAATTTRRGAAAPDDGLHTLDRIVVGRFSTPRRLLAAIRATSARR